MVKTSFKIFWSNAKGEPHSPQRQPQGEQMGDHRNFLKNSNTAPNYSGISENC
jgi:hypothetical protein